jgi:iron complex transport system permease protein
MRADRVVRWWGCSWLIPTGSRRFLSLALVAVLLVMLGALMSGPLAIPIADIYRALQQEADPLMQLVVNELRMPRLVLGLITGASLAVAGFLLQTLTRVSIASPAVMGLSDGAGLCVVLALFLGDRGWADVTSPLMMAAVAFFGAGLVLLILRGLFRLDPDLEKMVFAGLVIAAVCKASISLLMLVSQSDIASQAQLWLVGSLSQANRQLNQYLLGGFIVLCMLTLFAYRQIALFRISESLMLSLGESAIRQQRFLYVLAAGFTAIAVAGAGQIGFVGLVVPHLVQRLCPRGVPAQLFGNMLCGAVLVVLADIGARTLIAPYELPVGIITALIGVPCFLVLYLKRGKQ